MHISRVHFRKFPFRSAQIKSQLLQWDRPTKVAKRMAIFKARPVAERDENSTDSLQWLSGGCQDLVEFGSRRNERVENNVEDDLFYIIDAKHADQTKSASIRTGVIQQIRNIETKRSKSRMVVEFVELIEKDMLVIDSKKRCSAEYLLERLSKMVEKGTEDEEYMVGTD